MKMPKSLSVVMAILIMAVLLVTCLSPSFAAERFVTGSIGIETPLGSPDRPQDDSPLVKFDLRLQQFLGPIGLFGGGQVNLNKGLPFYSENKFWTGLELPLGKQGLVTYGYFERRFNLNDNRFMAGFKYRFAGTY